MTALLFLCAAREGATLEFIVGRKREVETPALFLQLKPSALIFIAAELCGVTSL